MQGFKPWLIPSFLNPLFGLLGHSNVISVVSCTCIFYASRLIVEGEICTSLRVISKAVMHPALVWSPQVTPNLAKPAPHPPGTFSPCWNGSFNYNDTSCLPGLKMYTCTKCTDSVWFKCGLLYKGESHIHCSTHFPLWCSPPMECGLESCPGQYLTLDLKKCF